MSDQANDTDSDSIKPPTTSLDEIPVEELIRLTRAFTRRITNQDRQRLARDLRETGHQRSIQITAPVALQRFFSGEIDLDSELVQRFLNAPLLSHVRYIPKPDEPLRSQASALFSSQDDSAILSVDVHLHTDPDASMEFTFTMFSALALSFSLKPLLRVERRRFIDLMRRENGIAFLWTRDRWEQPYVIFVVREGFARVYAFSPHGPQAAVRMTPDMVLALTDWLEWLWFPPEPVEDDWPKPEPAPLSQRPTLTRRPDGLPPPPPPQPEPAPDNQRDDQGAADSQPPDDLEW
ncbi:MAG: hypothetical protein JXJ20_02135 [Anaerolineae bacterium]|nr:hypothetical protein [Anaerolineae bacterium]